MLAVAAIAEGSVLPLAYSAYSAYPYAATPLAYYAAPHTTVVQSNPAPKVIAAPLAYSYAPYHYAYGAPIAYAAAPAIALQQKATYTAATPGAVHTADLPGHFFSQQSLNLAEAPKE